MRSQQSIHFYEHSNQKVTSHNICKQLNLYCPNRLTHVYPVVSFFSLQIILFAFFTFRCFLLILFPLVFFYPACGSCLCLIPVFCYSSLVFVTVIFLLVSKLRFLLSCCAFESSLLLSLTDLSPREEEKKGGRVE